MGLLSKDEEIIEVKHIKDVIELWKYWNEHDSAAGAGHWSHEGRLIHIYESKDKIFKINSKGTLISSEFKK